MNIRASVLTLRTAIQFLCVNLLLVGTLQAQAPASLAERIQRIIDRPEYRHASFGIKFYSLDSDKTIFARDSDKLFTPASTTKLLTEGAALELLGEDYQFHTRVYRTGPILQDGTLDGDLILVAGGDPNLSGRIQRDGTLAFVDEDHSYAGSPDTRAVAGDPLLVIRELAQQVADHHIRRINGSIRVDCSLFAQGEKELGTGVVISPIVVNDNIVDLTVSPGSAEGSSPVWQASPSTSYVHFINHARTGPAKSKPEINFAEDKSNSDGTHTVTVTGSMPLGSPPILFAYAAPEPDRFAAILFAEALHDKGVVARPAADSKLADFTSFAAKYTPETKVAEHVSPPLKEEVKVVLKVSQNLHASMTPYLLGALLKQKHTESDRAGFDVEHDFLTRANLDLSGASQTDGAGGAPAAFFTPDFMVSYLVYMAKQKSYPAFLRALPILGRDGTLARIQPKSPAAGFVHAKTGTFGAEDALNHKFMVTGKGLAGYMTTVRGNHLAFAIYANRVSVAPESDAIQAVGQTVGEIAAAAYDDRFETVAEYDVIIKNGRIVDGSGNPWYNGDIGIRRDRIVAIGKLEGATAGRVINAAGKIVAPGFIDMLGQSEMALLIDNRSLSKLSQGITTEITGEGGSIAPQNALTLAALQPALDQYHLKVDWTTLDGYFKRLEKNGTPLNLGTYVGAAQVREAVVGEADRAPSHEELEKMKALVAEAMQDGAFGVSTALIYPPGHYAKTEELIELAKVAGQYGGIYGSHMRSEGQSEIAALEEAFRIGREAHVPVEIFHLKVSGKSRWGNMPKVVGMIQAARDSGLDVSADMYPYIAGGTALASSLPPWAADGGMDKLLERLRDPNVRQRIQIEMAADHPQWENLYFDSGGGSGVMIASVVNKDLKKFEGKTVAEMAAAQGKPPLDAMFDFILADKGQTGALYFMANENDLQFGLKQPWTSLCLDANEMSLDGPIYEPHGHPRAFGAMTRFLGHYVRDLHLMPMEQGIRKMTSLPALREHLVDRGMLKPGYFADITIFDPAGIKDTNSFTEPATLSQGISYVLVNGQLEYENGQLTGAKSGRALRGRGWKGYSEEKVSLGERR